MSIAPNEGGLYKNLRELREANGRAECNFFKSLGFDYMFVDDGNDVAKMIEAFTKVKDINHPIVLHVVTEKGRGLKPAVENKEMFHWILPGTLDENKEIVARDYSSFESYNSITKDYILKKSSEDKTVITISPATPGVFGFDEEFRNKLASNARNRAIEFSNVEIPYDEVKK